MLQASIICLQPKSAGMTQLWTTLERAEIDTIKKRLMSFREAPRLERLLSLKLNADLN